MKSISKTVLLVLVIMPFNILAQADENITKLENYISNGQLVIYSSSSILSDNSASSLTYVDFCPGGIYYYSYDGSFTVKGTQGTSSRNNRAYGAGNSNNSGQWKVLFYQATYYLEITDAYNQKNYYPINFQLLNSGKWKNGNTTYVFARGKGRCG